MFAFFLASLKTDTTSGVPTSTIATKASTTIGDITSTLRIPLDAMIRNDDTYCPVIIRIAHRATTTMRHEVR